MNNNVALLTQSPTCFCLKTLVRVSANLPTIETSQKLIGSVLNTNDEWIGSLLLVGLPDKYFPMIMSIDQSGISITADTIKTKLLDMEDSTNSSGNNAFGTFYKKKIGNTTETKDKQISKKKVINCYKCKKVCHYRNECPNLGIYNRNSGKGSYGIHFAFIFLR